MSIASCKEDLSLKCHLAVTNLCFGEFNFGVQHQTLIIASVKAARFSLGNNVANSPLPAIQHESSNLLTFHLKL